MPIIETIWIVLQLLVGYHLIFPLVLAGIYVLAKPFQQIKKHDVAAEADYGIIVTAYEQTSQLPAVVASLLALNYNKYVIYIVADNCSIDGLDFKSSKVILLRPEVIIASNTGSHFYAIQHFIRPHERLTIIDSDNLVHPEYIHELNRFFEGGYQAVQGVREPKNLNTMYACLDAARDKYYHYYDGKILFGAGASATLAGSGMAFTTALYKECLQHRKIKGPGFDKILQYEIVKRGYRIAFAANAWVYDEKTAQSDQLVNQRARWLQSWFRYFGYGFHLTGKGIARLNWNQFLFGMVLLRPPLFLFLLAGAMMLFINLLIDPFVAAIWGLGFALFVAGFLLALANQATDPRIYRSLINIPRFMGLQLQSLMRARKAGKYSVATRHSTI